MVISVYIQLFLVDFIQPESIKTTFQFFVKKSAYTIFIPPDILYVEEPLDSLYPAIPGVQLWPGPHLPNCHTDHTAAVTL